MIVDAAGLAKDGSGALDSVNRGGGTAQVQRNGKMLVEIHPTME